MNILIVLIIGLAAYGLIGAVIVSTAGAVTLLLLARLLRSGTHRPTKGAL